MKALYFHSWGKACVKRYATVTEHKGGFKKY